DSNPDGGSELNPTLVPIPVSRPAEPWDGASRVTVLMLGLDFRDWEANSGPPRSDTMILFTIDPVTRTAGILSVPRDLWVNVPGFGYGKINTAYQNGEGSRYPDGGGAGLAIRTVEEFLGINIDYYIRVDFQAFVDFIDLIGGIKIENKSDEVIKIKIMHKETSVKLQPGKRYTLPGDHALAYARLRSTAGGDFDRSNRQQEVILAIRNQLLRPDVQPMLLANAFEIYQTLSYGIHTNLTPQEILKLGLLAQEISVENIKKGAITPPDHVTLDVSPDGLQILKPITSNIRILRDEIFTSSASLAPFVVSGDIKELMTIEAADIAVYNGTATAGLAGATQEYLVTNGVNVTTIDNADTISFTKIFLYSDKPYTVNYIMDLMKVPQNHFYYVNDPESIVDVEIVLGGDWIIPAQ
ncbi:MAG: LCP family protein, partial [Chloroflexota bacterium]